LHEIDLGSGNFTLDDIVRHLYPAYRVAITTKFRTAEETAAVDPVKLPGVVYQLNMTQLPTVYEVDVGIAERYGIKLTSFAEYFEEEKVNAALWRTLVA